MDVVELLAEHDGVGSVHQAAQQGLDLEPEEVSQQHSVSKEFVSPGDPRYLLVSAASEVVSDQDPLPGVGPNQVVHHQLEAADSPPTCLAQPSLQPG